MKTGIEVHELTVSFILFNSASDEAKNHFMTFFPLHEIEESLWSLDLADSLTHAPDFNPE
ncbi:hypothetical protein [Vibrio parahaemolyticus]|uniref:hypothetical protein n=1 Tax=Vibrio parahaemolyticus TaxID=670 RepID=UPI00081BF9E6|nr:hypothetical protein [Vibrio parahaemolyticus]